MARISAAIGVAFAQKTGGGVAKAVGEFREVHPDDRQVGEVVGQRFRAFVAVEPDADFMRSGEDRRRAAARQTASGKITSIREGDTLGRFSVGENEAVPSVVDDAVVLDQAGHHALSLAVSRAAVLRRSRPA